MNSIKRRSIGAVLLLLVAALWAGGALADMTGRYVGHGEGDGATLDLQQTGDALAGTLAGVVEGALTFGLVAAGMPEDAAFAAVVLYRFSTFYLPPLWGFFAFRHLEPKHYL